MQIINANLTEQIYSWTPPKTGSSRAEGILSKLGFKSYTPSEKYLKPYSEFLHVHDCVILNNPNYKLLLTVRNPYEQMVSYYLHSIALNKSIDKEIISNGKFKPNDKINQTDFELFIHSLSNASKWWCWECFTFDKVYPDYIIRSENMFEDYLKIPFVTKTKYFKSGELYNDCNVRVNESKYEKFDYRDLINQRIADSIFYNFAHIFSLGDYERNSWKK